jgi:hypothetical protein
MALLTFITQFLWFSWWRFGGASKIPAESSKYLPKDLFSVSPELHRDCWYKNSESHRLPISKQHSISHQRMTEKVADDNVLSDAYFINF